MSDSSINGVHGALPEQWINLAAHIPYALPLPQNPDGSPTSFDDLTAIYSAECARIELLDGRYRSDPYISIPSPVLDEYRKYRPTPLCRARGLERRLNYSGEIYFKREDWNPTGSHKAGSPDKAAN